MKKLTLLVVGLLLLAGAMLSTVRPSNAAAVLCVYLKPPTLGVPFPGWYYVSPEFPGHVLGGCSK